MIKSGVMHRLNQSECIVMTKDQKPEAQIEMGKKRTSKDTQFKKGQVPNPKGRPVGSGIQGELRRMLNSHMPEMVEKLITMARGGDLGALRILMDKGLGNRKPESYIEIHIPEELSIADKVDYALNAVTRGELPAELANELAKTAVLSNTLKDISIGGTKVIELNVGSLVDPDMSLEVKEPKEEQDNG